MISKASTTLDVKDGVADTVAKAKLDLAAIDYFVHGSTVAINTVIERKGAFDGPPFDRRLPRYAGNRSR